MTATPRSALVSLDLDGTLEFGEPRGVITPALVHRLWDSGHVVGSCSDNTASYQRRMWRRHGIELAFAVPKHGLADLRSAFKVAAYIHIGDNLSDEIAAGLGGFRFLRAQPWTSDEQALAHAAELMSTIDQLLDARLSAQTGSSFGL